jgi:hypothetical protein
MNKSRLIKIANIEGILKDKQTAHLIVNKDKVLSSSEVEGLSVETENIENGINLKMNLKKNVKVKNPVHLCFGVLEKKAVQRILIDFNIEEGSNIFVVAHCIFPEAEDVKHTMDAKINIGKDASYKYLERHIHGFKGGIKVYPKAKVLLEERARFRTDFELLQGRVGELAIDYETTCRKDSVMEMTAKVDGTGNDSINIKESGNLEGENSKGVLTTRVALRNKAKAEIYNKLKATAAYARGHVDCKEIVQDESQASAVPIVEVNHPKAHITHEAAIGSVDSKQLQTLMSRGLSEDEATDLIIKGLLQ